MNDSVGRGIDPRGRIIEYMAVHHLTVTPGEHAVTRHHVARRRLIAPVLDERAETAFRRA
jgi:hypothetical protein